jgi:mono/diheme cytochrome c family protein
MIKTVAVFLGLSAAFFLFTDFSRVNAGDYTEALALVQERCASCHNLTRVRQNVGKNDAQAWDDYVARMQRKGAKVTDSERADIVRFLSSLESGGDL